MTCQTTVCWPHADPISTLWRPMLTLCWSCADPVLALCRPCADPVLTLCWPQATRSVGVRVTRPSPSRTSNSTRAKTSTTTLVSRTLPACPCTTIMAAVSASSRTRDRRVLMRMASPWWTTPWTTATPNKASQITAVAPRAPVLPLSQRKNHTRGNIWSFSVGWHEYCDPAGGAGALCNFPSFIYFYFRIYFPCKAVVRLARP